MLWVKKNQIITRSNLVDENCDLFCNPFLKFVNFMTARHAEKAGNWRSIEIEESHA